jgi:hypothetical protein
MVDDGYRLGKRQFQEDFSPGPFPNISLVRRPGALSLDYQTCFTLGPKGLGDTSAGPIDRPWKIRYDPATLSFYASAANNANTDWQPEVLLFTHTGTVFEEIDASFDQNAHIIVCGQKEGHIWVYFFNGIVGDFVFTDFGLGRTPNVVLDNPLDTSQSDVIVFFLDDAANRLRYLLQRDRYAVRYDTPAVGIQDSYIEDAIRSRDHRIQVYFTTRNDEGGTYSLQHIESTLYPYFLFDIDSVTPRAAFTTLSTLRAVLIIISLTDIDAVRPGFSFPDDGRDLIRDTLITWSTFDLDAATPGYLFSDAFLVTISPAPIISVTLFDIDAVTPSYVFQSGTIVVTLILVTLFDIDGETPSYSFQATSSLV